MITKIEVPDGNLLKWVLDNPKAAADAIRLLNALAAVQVDLVTPSGTATLAGNKSAIKFSDTNALIPLPLKFATAWSQPTGSPSRASFDANASTSASLTYQQSELAQINTRLQQTRQVLAALIFDLISTGQAQVRY